MMENHTPNILQSNDCPYHKITILIYTIVVYIVYLFFIIEILKYLNGVTNALFKNK